MRPIEGIIITSAVIYRYNHKIQAKMLKWRLKPTLFSEMRSSLCFFHSLSTIYAGVCHNKHALSIKISYGTFVIKHARQGTIGAL